MSTESQIQIRCDVVDTHWQGLARSGKDSSQVSISPEVRTSSGTRIASNSRAAPSPEPRPAQSDPSGPSRARLLGCDAERDAI